MRFSLLAGLPSTHNSKSVKLKQGDEISHLQRVHKVVFGTIWSSVLAVGIGFLVLSVMTLLSVVPEELAEEQPTTVRLIAAGVALSACLLSVTMQCQRTPFAQFTGLAIGVLGSLTIVLARLAMGLPIVWYEWSVVPVVGALSFLLGLSMSRPPAPVEEFEYTPIDAWDRDSRPSEREIDPARSYRWNRLLIGMGVGLSMWDGLGQLLTLLLKPLIRNPSILEVAMARVEHPLHLVACVAAGIAAAAGTSFGFLQGLLVGFAVAAFRQVTYPASTPDELVISSVLAVIGAAIGGGVGSAIFRPYRVFGNAKGVKNAPTQAIEQPATVS
jgi:hypothetical protein